MGGEFIILIIVLGYNDAGHGTRRRVGSEKNLSCKKRSVFAHVGYGKGIYNIFFG